MCILLNTKLTRIIYIYIYDITSFISIINPYINIVSPFCHNVTLYCLFSYFNINILRDISYIGVDFLI